MATTRLAKEPCRRCADSLRRAQRRRTHAPAVLFVPEHTPRASDLTFLHPRRLPLGTRRRPNWAAVNSKDTQFGRLTLQVLHVKTTHGRRGVAQRGSGMPAGLSSILGGRKSGNIRRAPVVCVRACARACVRVRVCRACACCVAVATAAAAAAAAAATTANGSGHFAARQETTR